MKLWPYKPAYGVLLASLWVLVLIDIELAEPGVQIAGTWLAVHGPMYYSSSLSGIFLRALSVGLFLVTFLALFDANAGDGIRLAGGTALLGIVTAIHGYYLIRPPARSFSIGQIVVTFSLTLVAALLLVDGGRRLWVRRVIDSGCRWE